MDPYFRDEVRYRYIRYIVSVSPRISIAGTVLALLIGCRAPYKTEHVPLNDAGVTLLVTNSNVKHSLSGSEYPDRVRQCKEACAAMRAAGHSSVGFLRDASLETLRAAKDLDEVTRKRATHGISEDQRKLRAKEALKAVDYTRVGKLMLESHACTGSLGQLVADMEVFTRNDDADDDDDAEDEEEQEEGEYEECED